MENSDRHGTEFVFYVYDEGDDPRYGFWMLMGDNRSISLYERPPEGNGMWLKLAQDESDYASIEPTDELLKLLGEFGAGNEIAAERVDELPSHEQHFVSVIHGTAEENIDAIPNPIQTLMHDLSSRL